MKTQILILALCAGSLLYSQTTIKITKPIPAKDWENFKSQHEKSIYGDFRILETKGKIIQILGDKPVNPSDKASWRPPVIPPLLDADFVGKPKISTKGDAKYSITKIRPKPVNPNCETCSTIIIGKQVSEKELKEIQNFLEPYQ